MALTLSAPVAILINAIAMQTYVRTISMMGIHNTTRKHTHDVVERVVVAGQCIGGSVVAEEALYHQRATEGEVSYEANSERYQSQREQPQYCYDHHHGRFGHNNMVPERRKIK